MIRAAPRKNANGDACMRPWRSGTSHGMRAAFWSTTSWTGSDRVVAGDQSPWADRGTAARAARPRSTRSSTDARAWADAGSGGSSGATGSLRGSGG